MSTSSESTGSHDLSSTRVRHQRADVLGWAAPDLLGHVIDDSERGSGFPVDHPLAGLVRVSTDSRDTQLQRDALVGAGPLLPFTAPAA